jgi:predicted metal-dependent hydrolase
MTHVQDNIAYGAVSIPYTVVRRRRKTLEIAVEPDSSVSVAAPISASAEFIRAKVRKRAAWILSSRDISRSLSHALQLKIISQGKRTSISGGSTD